MTAASSICYETPTKFARYSVSSTVGIAKGTILKLVNASANHASTATIGSAAAGIAFMQKSVNDRSNEIVAALNGTWGFYGSTAGTITAGQDVVYASTGHVTSYTTLDKEKGRVIGKALETVTTPGAVMKVRVNII